MNAQSYKTATLIPSVISCAMPDIGLWVAKNLRYYIPVIRLGG